MLVVYMCIWVLYLLLFLFLFLFIASPASLRRSQTHILQCLYYFSLLLISGCAFFHQVLCLVLPLFCFVLFCFFYFFRSALEVFASLFPLPFSTRSHETISKSRIIIKAARGII
uniref:Putative uncharacterized protein YOR082C n=1 Tax=Saccharomyces cerevisiae (strain ATCC 204508 / S288c) TaxID=559292 RepID=YO082_YEAST|nr:RecName: Full=Putative uncharacterized protein YOR082C; Flags: Precursor [Saccharomyces cerevisiae S288C]AAT93369.1 YOR082C [Saccharomyces cerevisiae]CAA99276.1 unnamed protein product [Saccharomyces cerevisiae]